MGVPINKRGRRSYVDNWSDRHAPEREPNQRGDWSEEQDEWLKAQCKTKISYSQMEAAFNEAFPRDTKSRNALLGRAARKGYNIHKPVGATYGRPKKESNSYKTGLRKPRKVANLERTKRIKTAPSNLPVVFKDKTDPGFRPEGERGIERNYRYSRKLGAGHPEVVERRKGKLPCIVEERPLTTVPVAICEKESCMWPTSEDIRCMEVCGAPVEVGAYCARHADVAYRVMPTRRRQALVSKDNVEHRVRIDASQHRERLDPDGEWLSRQIMEMDEITVNSEDDGIAPLAIPFFMDKVVPDAED